jgi:outer membrane lipoprotein-sorting protein
MKNLVLFIGFLFCSISLPAQYKKATDTEKNDILNRIVKASEEIKTMQGDFTQVKELSFMDEKVTSEGKLFFKQENKIRWEYTSPYRYVFSMDGQSVRMTTGDKTSRIPVKQSKMFSAISNIMVGGVSGKGLIDSKDFETDLFVGSKDYKLIFTPQKKEVKDLFSAIRLYVNKADYRIIAVEMVENSGDMTAITLKNVKINTAINDEIFSN